MKHLFEFSLSFHFGRHTQIYFQGPQTLRGWGLIFPEFPQIFLGPSLTVALGRGFSPVPETFPLFLPHFWFPHSNGVTSTVDFPTWGKKSLRGDLFSVHCRAIFSREGRSRSNSQMGVFSKKRLFLRRSKHYYFGGREEDKEGYLRVDSRGPRFWGGNLGVSHLESPVIKAFSLGGYG